MLCRVGLVMWHAIKVFFINSFFVIFTIYTVVVILQSYDAIYKQKLINLICNIKRSPTISSRLFLIKFSFDATYGIICINPLLNKFNLFYIYNDRFI